MGIFNYVSEIGGSNKPFIARIKLGENVDVEKGDILYFNEETHMVSPVMDGVSKIAGVCACTYKAAANDLVPAWGSGVVDVIVSPDALYRVPAFTISDVASNQDYVIQTGLPNIEFKNVEGCVGSKMVLVEKGEASTNPHSVGDVFVVESIVSVDGIIGFAMDKKIYGCDGDKYVFIPGYGFELFKIQADGSFELQVESLGDIIVMDADVSGYTVKLKELR